MDESTRAALWTQARLDHAQPGQSLAVQGATVNSLLVLLAGEASSVAVSIEGRTASMGTWRGPVVIDKVTSFTEQRHPATIEADSTVTWCRVPIEAVLDGIDQNPAAQGHVLRALADAAKKSRDSFVAVATTSSRARTARWILEHNEASGIVLSMPQTRLAQRLGMTRVTLNRCLHGLVRDHLILIDGKRITVLDVPRLEAVAEISV
jgi:CRP-like cAMP-binding protein